MKHTGGTPSKPIWLAIGLLLSLLAHGLVLLLPGFSDPSPKLARDIEITLAPPLKNPLPEPLAPQLDLEPEPAAVHSPAPPSDLPLAEAITDSQGSQPAIETDQPAQDPSHLLRARIITAIAREHGRIEPPGERNALESAALPRLPDSPGWLNDYVGTISPRVDRWAGNDGSRHTRIVMASGQIVCGRADPPTPAEMFNPSLAMNIMRFTPCGRQRPTPVDRSDPWVRVPAERE
jgi:hypothetical protein